MSARELVVLLSLCTVWGLHFTIAKVAVDSVPPMFYAAMRMSLVALVLSPMLRWRPGRMAPVLAAGACLGALNYAFMFSGLSRAPASATAVAVELYVPFATILSVIFLRETVGWRRILGITLAFIGVAIIALGRNEEAAAAGDQVALGVGLVACAAMVESVGAILIKRARDFGPLELLAWFGVMGALILWPGTFIIESGHGEALAATDPTFLIGAVVFSALVASVFGHGAYYWLLQRLPVSQVAPSALLTTLLAVGFSILLLGEALTARFMIGGALALTGVGIVLLRGARKAPIIEPGAPEPAVAPPQEGRRLQDDP